MPKFLSYIVFLFLSFNISTAFSAEIVFEPIENDLNEIQAPDFLNASGLPHPAQMYNILNSDSSPIGNLIILGRYFDARYPKDTIKADFSEDVALIFPDLAPDDLQKTTQRIRSAVFIYRAIKQKIEEAKKKALVPEDPPLIVPDDEYAIIGDRDYLETQPDQVAIISDFKKVIGYSHNKREIEAMEEWLYHTNDKNKPSTDFEKFRQMLSKIEFSKIPSYGVTLPSPFVGNAGIGKWIEKDGIRARLISETARLSTNAPFLAALHLTIPNHRIMLATRFDDEHTKPTIRLIDTKNVASYDIFYPLPVQVTYKQMLGAYRGDFAFPIKITPKEAQKDVSFKAEITFQNCDIELDCFTQTLTPDITIESDLSGSNTSSSMTNFIRQSFYNIPQEKNKYLKLSNFSFNNENSTLNFEFETNAKPNNIAFFLENEKGTLFYAPEIMIGSDKIYIQTSPIENQPDFLSSPLKYTVRLNNYATLRQTFIPNTYQNISVSETLFDTCLFLFLAGLLFYLTPFGFALTQFPLFEQNTAQKRKIYLISKATTLFVGIETLFAFLRSNPDIVYFSAQNNLLYLSFALTILSLRLLCLNFKYPNEKKSPTFLALIDAFQILFFIPIAIIFLNDKIMQSITNMTLIKAILYGAAFSFALILPSVVQYFFKTQKFKNLKALHLVFIYIMLFISWLTVLLSICFLISPWSLFKVGIFVIIGLLILKYLLHFWEALYKAQLPQNYVSNTNRVLICLFVLMLTLLSFCISAVGSLKPLSLRPDLSSLNEQILNGEKILLGFQSQTCLLCKYNNFTTLTENQIKTLQDEYKITYLPVIERQPSAQTIQFLKKYKSNSLPLYVLYTPQTPQGVVLPKILTTDALSQTFDNFNIYPSSSFKEALEKRRKTPLR